MRRRLLYLPVVFPVLLLAACQSASATNHPTRSFIFEERGPEVAELYRLGLDNNPAHVARFCEALGSEDMRVRQAAIAQLVFTPDESALEPVIAAMKDESPWVRRGAIAVLEKLGDSRAKPVLKEALTLTPPPPRSGRDAGRWRRFRPMPGEPGRELPLRDEEYFNRLAAALALHRLGSDAGVPTVLAMLKGPHTKPVLQMAAKCVILMDLKQATPDLLKMARDCNSFGEDSPGLFAIRALRIMGDPAYGKEMVALGLEKFDTPGNFIKMEAFNLVAIHGDESALPLLRAEVVKKTNWREIQRAIVAGLRRLRPQDAASLLTQNYLSPFEIDPETGQMARLFNPRVFQLAAQAVAELGDKGVLDDLKASYKRFSEPTDYFVYRLYLAYAIAGLGDGYGVTQLHKALGHEDAAVRRVAAKLLGVLGTRESLGPLGKALRAESERITFNTMKASLERLGAPASAVRLPAPALPPTPADTYGKPRYLHVTFDDCTTIESMERFVGLMEELADQDVRWVSRMYVAALSRHDFQYATMLLQRCFDRGCEFQNHSLHHNPDGQSLRARTPDQVRLDCGGCTNWLHGNIMGCDRIYRWKSGGGSFRRPGDPVIDWRQLREVIAEAFWAKNIQYGWPGIERAYPDVYAPPYHFGTESPVVSSAVRGDLGYAYEGDTLEEMVSAFVESFDHCYFNQPERVFELSGHDWPNSSIPIRVGLAMNWPVLRDFLREVLLNRRDRYPRLYSMTGLELTHIFRRGLDPEDILDLKVHLQDSPEF
ncbi:MAG: HEAT repeat domain-containing protein [Candidatus Brocadiae bacterium]|nr:HEAT repeat domain-containing protein [Candidatus Brocadiia bacterium]